MRRTAPLLAVLLTVAVLSACGDGHAPPTTTSADRASYPTVTLDPVHDYGDRYADGVLPVGDGKYRTTSPKKGYVYACATYAQSLSNGGPGASVRGPWFSADGTTYDVNAKVHVQGQVPWDDQHKFTVKGRHRIVTTNDLPEHDTGTFPMQTSDPAYTYDRNPNSIQSQHVQLTLKRHPKYGSPQCMGGQVGVMLTGAELFNGFDAGARDAGAWEVQDGCSGHPQMQGTYHYHTLSSCIHHASVHRVIGWALDGFPITGPVVGKHNILTTRDLDVCHGLVSIVKVDGAPVTTYHYVMTQDFPYSASCFRAKPVSTDPVG